MINPPNGLSELEAFRSLGQSGISTFLMYILPTTSHSRLYISVMEIEASMKQSGHMRFGKPIEDLNQARSGQARGQAFDNLYRPERFTHLANSQALRL